MQNGVESDNDSPKLPVGSEPLRPVYASRNSKGEIEGTNDRHFSVVIN
jgi:hypothetical protein